MRLTPCECPTSGWCERHRCLKPDRLFQLCCRNQTMFQAWEEGRGPCFSVQHESEIDASSGEMPGLARRIANFGAATARHALNCLREVGDAVFESRLAICRQCSSCDIEHMICREISCGCYLQTKAKWESENCPRGLWPPQSDPVTNPELNDEASPEA